jgi:membrane protease YdiL (CAAX protease family)
VLAHAAGAAARPVVGFFALTFAVTWTFWAAAAAVARNASLAPPLVLLLLYLGTFTPALVAIALTARGEGRAGVRALVGRLFQGRVAVRWYVFALAFMTAIKLASATVYRVATGAWPVVDLVGLPLMLGATLLSAVLLGQAGEELGWRGFALPRMASRMGLGKASVLLGVIWAAWHLPFFYLALGEQHGQSFPLYLVQVTGISVAIAWLYAHTGGSLLLTMLMHAAINNTRDVVPAIPRPPLDPFIPDAPLLGWIGAGMIWVAGAYCLVTMPTFGKGPESPEIAMGVPSEH